MHTNTLPTPCSLSHPLHLSHTQVIKDDCQTDLDAAMPAYESALKALATLDKKSVQEMKGFTNPPEMVKFTLEAVCILLEVKPGKMMIRLFYTHLHYFFLSHTHHTYTRTLSLSYLHIRSVALYLSVSLSLFLAQTFSL